MEEGGLISIYVLKMFIQIDAFSLKNNRDIHDTAKLFMDY